MGEAADVADVVRAAVSAGELLLKGVESGYLAYQGAKGLAAKLASKLGGGGPQIPLRKLVKRSLPAAMYVLEQDVESLRAKAEDFGVQFAVTPTDEDGVVILACERKHEGLFRDLLTNPLRGDAPVPSPDAADYELRPQSPGMSYDGFTLHPHDASRFCAAAREEGIPYEADTRYVDPDSCLEELEIPIEAADAQIGWEAPPQDLRNWEVIREEPACSARMPAERIAQIRPELPPDVLIAVAPGQSDALCCFAKADRDILERFDPDLEWFHLVPEEILRERAAIAMGEMDSVGIVSLTEDRERVVGVLNHLGIEPQTPPAPVAEVEKCLPSLSTRLENAMTRLQEESAQRTPELSCTLSERDAAALRVSAQAAGIELSETKLPDGRVRFAAFPQAAAKAEDLLRSAGLRAGFARGGRTGAEPGR